jgi:hypothetical protein
MNTKTQTRAGKNLEMSTDKIPKSLSKEYPWWARSTPYRFTILIDNDYGVVTMIQRIKWLGTKYTMINVLRTGLYIQPQMWIMVPGWVWRKVKRMIEGGESREKISGFIGSVMAGYAGMDGEFRKDYEEPHRLLSIFF